MKTRLLLLALVSLQCHAGLYKWIDGHGQVHYSDTPPPQQSIQQIRPQVGSEADAEAARRELADKLSESERRRIKAREDEDERRAKEEEQRAKEQACRSARERLTLLQQSPRIARVNPQGQRYILEEPERQAAIIGAQQQVAERCK